ncbi:MAG: AAA family ATPase [Magnetococcales bacterium]|nr:AAA family ATPase [Magnetococcales bacterium]
MIRPAIEQVGLQPLRVEDLITGEDFVREMLSQILRADVVVVVFNVKLKFYPLSFLIENNKKTLCLLNKEINIPELFVNFECAIYDLKNFIKSREVLILALDNLMQPALIAHPSPETQATPGIPSLPLTLRRIEIRGFQCIQSTGVADLPSDAPWIIITGDNGEGKTSVLQAMAIGLHGAEEAEMLLKGNPSARIGVELRATGRSAVRNFSRQNGHWIMTDHRFKPIEPFERVVAYGPARTEILAETSMDREMARLSPVRSLLQQRGYLGNIEHWLKMRILTAAGDDRGQRDELSRQRARRVKEILVDLLPGVTRMELVGEHFKYTENGYEVTVHQLSSGQVSLLAMVGDLLIRLYAMHPEAVDPQDLHGIVLIDELDVHLHPSRQRALPGQLSRIFPNVQFVATTHSVIPILGVPKGSVFLRAKRDPVTGTHLERLEINPANLLPNAILTSPLFDMESIRSVQNLKLADVHTDDDFQEVRFKERVDQALERLARIDHGIPKDFLQVGE